MFGHKGFVAEACDKREVIVSVTAYRRDLARDRLWLGRLIATGRKLSLFPQGNDDIAYFRQLLGQHADRIQTLPRDLNYLRDYSIRNEAIIVGTRLHLIMFALQNGIPGLVLVVDNRARELGLTFKHLPVTTNGEQLAECSEFEYSVPEDFDAAMVDVVRQVIQSP